MKNSWKTLSINTVYENPWIRVSHREVITPSDTEGIYGVVHFKNLAVGIVPLDDDGYTTLVGQWRYTLDQYSWEIPEGGCPAGQTPMETARRELREETGISAKKWKKILEFHTSNSVTDEFGMAFLARDLSYGAAEPEETEDIVVKKMPLAEAIEWMQEGRITDALSIMALQKVQIMSLRGEL